MPVTRTVGGSWTDIETVRSCGSRPGGCPEGTFLDGLSAPVPRTDHPAVCLVRRTGNWLAAVVVAGAERARPARYITVLDSVLAVYLVHDGLRRGVARPVGGLGTRTDSWSPPRLISRSRPSTIGDNRRTIALNYSPGAAPCVHSGPGLIAAARGSRACIRSAKHLHGQAPSSRKCGTAKPGRNQQHARTGPTFCSEQHSLTLTCKPPFRSSHS